MTRSQIILWIIFKALGAEVLVFQNNCITSKQLMTLDATHIVLGPGPGRPEQAGNMMSIIDNLLGTIPMLGICLGHQAIALAYGAAVVHSPRPTHGIPCWIKHRQRGLFDRLLTPSSWSLPFIVSWQHSSDVDP